MNSSVDEWACGAGTGSTRGKGEVHPACRSSPTAQTQTLREHWASGLLGNGLHAKTEATRSLRTKLQSPAYFILNGGEARVSYRLPDTPWPERSSSTYLTLRETP